MNEGIITGIFMVIVAVIEGFAFRDRARGRASMARAESRAKRRAEESELSMGLMIATAKSVKVIAKKVLGVGHLNGDVEDSMDCLDGSLEAYEAWKTRTAAQQVAKM